jgi:hypothetical protein
MELIIGISVVITVIYGTLKGIEYRYYKDECQDNEFSMKRIIRNVVMVLISSFISLYFFFLFQVPIQQFLNIITQTKTTDILTEPPILTDEPNF